MNYSPHSHPHRRQFPPLEAFERLIIKDGLQITAERWQVAHQYHRQRQNFHYQALHQSGIVSGLGIVPIDAPSQVSADYQDGRWVQVQPGIAIDTFGNPIVVTTPQDFHIASVPPEGQIWDVVIVAQYVDPDDLSHPTDREQAPELFRIVEKTHLDDIDVELCRIRLDGTFSQVQTATDVYHPPRYSLDFRHRAFVQTQPWGVVRIAHLKHDANPDANTQALRQLITATDGLFPPLKGEGPIPVLPLQDITGVNVNPYDLLFITYSDLLQLKAATLTALKPYLEAGGTLLVMIQAEAARLSELRHTHQDLLAGLEALEESINPPAPVSTSPSLSDPDIEPSEDGGPTDEDLASPHSESIGIATTAIKSLNRPGDAEISQSNPNNPDDLDIRDRLQSEIDAYAKDIRQTVQNFNRAIVILANQMDYPLDGGRLAPDHPIRRYPFLFSQFPLVNGQPVSLSNWGGIVVVVGDLTASWDIQPDQPQSRETIRTAQELGINLLHFAWRRRHLMELQRLPNQPTPSPSREGN